MRLGGKHTGKMGGSSCSGNDHFDPAARSRFSIGKQAVGSPMRGDDQQFVGHAELGEHGHGFFQYREIGLAASKHPDKRMRR